MKKFFLIFLFRFVLPVLLFSAEDPSGLWVNIDNRTGFKRIYIYIYKYQNKLFGRIVVTFRDGVIKDLYNKRCVKAEKWVGEP